MTIRQYLALMIGGTLLCWAGFVVIIFSVDPTSAPILEFLFFYVSLFLAVVGTCSVGGLWVRRVLFKNDDLLFRHVKNAFRQSLLMAATLIIFLALLALQLLVWWNALLLVFGMASIEAFVFSERRFRNTLYGP